jgi:hypothetical protein
VSHIIQGPTKIMWSLLPSFTDSGPYEFQLQVGNIRDNVSGDWEDVGLPILDQFAALDDSQRVWGKTNTSHYRIKLTTPSGVYVSAPENGFGVLDRRSWRLAKEHARIALRQIKVGNDGQCGVLLKRRWVGQDCPVCLDLQTKEVKDPNCPTCYGTGKLCGYYYPISCFWAELSPRSTRTELDGLQTRGTIQDVAVTARVVFTELLEQYDVWVSLRTDDRYFVHRVNHTLEMRGVPIVGNIELRLVPFSHVVYSVPIPDQLAANTTED